MLKMLADMTYKSNTGALRKKIKSAARIALTEQARTIANEAKRLIVRSNQSSRPGELPRSRTGNYKRSIKYTVKPRAMVALVGPSWPKGAHAGMLKWGTNRMEPRLVPSEVALENTKNKLVASFKDRL